MEARPIGPHVLSITWSGLSTLRLVWSVASVRGGNAAELALGFGRPDSPPFVKDRSSDLVYSFFESGTPSPNPWDLTLSCQNVCSRLERLERRIGLRRDAT